MQREPFEHLNFDPPRRLRLSARALWMLSVGAIYLLAHWLLPNAIAFWLVLVLLMASAWAASFGWRAAVQQVSQFVQRLERL